LQITVQKNRFKKRVSTEKILLISSIYYQKLMKTIATYLSIILISGLSFVANGQNVPEREKVLLTSISYDWNNSLWGLHSYRVYEYNDNDQVVSIFRYHNYNGDFSLTDKTMYEYYEDFDSLKSVICYNPNVIGGYTYHFSYYYDDSLRLIQENYIINFPDPGIKYIYTYEYDEYKLIKAYGYLAYLDPAYLKSYKIYYYNSDNRFSGYLFYVLNDTVWIKSDSAFYKYDTNGYVIKKEYFNRNVNEWQNEWLREYSYNDNYTEWEEVLLKWKDTAWSNEIKTLKWFDEEGYVTKMIRMDWNDSIWENLDKEVYFYGVLGDDEIKSVPKVLNIYPNPCAGKFNIEINNKNSAKETISVINISGQEVLQIVNTESKINTVDISDLSAGLYIIKMTEGNNCYLGKVIKQ